MDNTGKKIVIFDDDEDILSICTYILEEDGWEVVSFTDCNNPVEKLGNVLPNVILMDNWIPDTGGIEATQALKRSAELRHIPVIYFSANSDIGLLAQQAGANTYLAKPFDIADLQRVLADALKGN
jgi:CheY-like chemotaxis protein